MSWPDEPVRVRVPATSANLGPGFDALGLALALHDEVEARITQAGVSIEVTGEGQELAGAGEKHLVLRAMRAAFGALGGGQPPGIALRCVNRIPHGRGLGSSAAAIVSGILAARALAGRRGVTGEASPGGRPGADGDEAVLALATELEGHPDNVAACIHGGLTIAWLADGAPRAVRLSPLPGIVPVAVIAPAPVSTKMARGLLPPAVPHRDAALSAGRSALLVAALTAEPGALLDATEDRLHQDYRAPAMPATSDLVRRLRKAGIPAVVSGAGPSVLALFATGGRPPGDPAPSHALGDPPPGRPREGTFPSGLPLPEGTFPSGLPSPEGTYPSGLPLPLDRLDSIVRETGIEWLISPLDVERHGASIQPASPPGPVAGGRPRHSTWNRASPARGDAAQSSPGR
ncbi:MAG: homoserine kinase [Streptosporangiaceae bacterium]|nr:homoserine kinase [Streptosporangiaceae bacterium]MBV9855245.1 homoserine kinase [Streptosporangiaceae bacterium]